MLCKPLLPKSGQCINVSTLPAKDCSQDVYQHAQKSASLALCDVLIRWVSVGCAIQQFPGCTQLSSLPGEHLVLYAKC